MQMIKIETAEPEIFFFYSILSFSFFQNLVPTFPTMQFSNWVTFLKADQITGSHKMRYNSFSFLYVKLVELTFKKQHSRCVFFPV